MDGRLALAVVASLLALACMGCACAGLLGLLHSLGGHISQTPPPLETRQGVYWGRALAGGLVWLVILYISDTIDSYYLIERGIRHVDADGEAARMLRTRCSSTWAR